MEHYASKKVIKIENILTDITCDHCLKLIEKNEGYWHVTTSHSDWGVNSVDSYEHKDYCCKECLSVAFLKYIDESGSKDHRNTLEMDIEHMYNVCVNVELAEENEDE